MKLTENNRKRWQTITANEISKAIFIANHNHLNKHGYL